jgi:two-component system chemotaxis response regulator CheB
VDDSAFVRKVVREMLSRSPFIEVVGQARDGEEALAVVRDLKPDVVTCDIQMPRIGGVEFVRKQMASNPVPILILTASPEDGDAVMQAVDAGAVDFVRKPTALATQELLGMREELIEKVKAAAGAPVGKLHALAPAQHVAEKMRTPSKGRAASSVDAVVIGISTGGPQALRYLLPQFPADFPVPVLIVLHMPVGYTAMFAEKLDEICELKVIEAGEGTPVQAGQAIVAQAGRHLLVKRNAAGMVRTQLSVTPVEKPHRPSVDVLFESAAETYRSRVLAVVMTGMGEDGRQGCAWIKAQGGIVLTEAEESCVIYGMPRAVVDAGLSDASCRLEEMAGTISKYI